MVYEGSEEERMRVPAVAFWDIPRTIGHAMAKKKQPPQHKLGKSDRYPSDYGLRDREEGGSWVPGDKGQGREGLSKGYGGSAGKGT